MDYFQGVVVDFLRANRQTFVNEECCIQLNEGGNPVAPYWICDAVAIQPARKRAFLCEITYSKTLGSLLKRLRLWRAHWPTVLKSLQRDCGIPADWNVCPWIFIPDELSKALKKSLPAIVSAGLPEPRITVLEDVLPWKYPEIRIEE